MKALTKLLIGAAAAGAVSAEIINIYQQVMGRNDRFEMPLTKYFKGIYGDYSDWDEWMKEREEWADNAEHETIKLRSDRGEELSGYYWPPEGGEEPKVIVVGSHGYHGSYRSDPYTFLKHYHDRGYGFFTCDHTATGTSGGKYVGFDYFESQDLAKWLAYLRKRFGSDVKFILHGVSMGSSTVLKLAGFRCPEQVELIIADCGYTSAKDEFIYLANLNGIKNAEPVYKAFNALNKLMAGYDFEDTDVKEDVKHAAVPILFIHGDADTFVPTKMGHELYDLAPEDKRELVIVKGAPHACSLLVDEDGVFEAIDRFIDERL